ncbi:4'-phosphopantetheinyl transferase [Oerskovia sp. NPDC060338]|uniref:4'-phosphopantetheinyl transferase family protein n=1 Tax=Oerskovia sp. NPDC060338 TaxID=3347100 RepID=UPI0036557F25
MVDGARAPRREEFASVRACARLALARLGVGAVPILPCGSGPMWARRAPRWPSGIVGSMTHTTGYAAAAVASDDTIASVGLDAEVNASLPDEVCEYIIRPDERSQLVRLGESGHAVAWERLLFSVKEAVFKAWFPVAKSWLGFDECRVELGAEGVFRASLLGGALDVSGSRIHQLDGVWHVVPGAGTDLLVTLVVVPRHE